MASLGQCGRCAVCKILVGFSVLRFDFSGYMGARMASPGQCGRWAVCKTLVGLWDLGFDVGG